MFPPRFPVRTPAARGRRDASLEGTDQMRRMMTITQDEFDLDIRLGAPVRAGWLAAANDPPTDPDPDSHEYTCGSACPSNGPYCEAAR